jgi:hypothetical protein
MKGDPYWITARRADSCTGCKARVRAGDRVFYYPNTRAIYCEAEACGAAASRDFDARAFDDAMVSGW